MTDFHLTFVQEPSIPVRISKTIIIDDALSEKSRNPVENRVIARELKKLGEAQNSVIGDISTALDGIISLQESLIGGVE